MVLLDISQGAVRIALVVLRMFDVDKTKFLVIAHRGNVKIENVFPIPLLSQHVMPAVSTRNLGAFLKMTVMLKNIFLSLVEYVIIIFMIYGVFVGICLFLLQKLLQLR